MAKKKLCDVLEHLKELANKGDVSLDDVLKSFGTRAYAPLYFIFGLVLLSPIGALPGATAVFGTLIALLAAQSLFTDSPWVPKTLRKRHAKSATMKRWVDRCIPYVKKAERYAKPRWSWCVKPPFSYISSFFIFVLGISTYGLGLIPGGLILPGLALIFLALALFHHDGVWMMTGLVFGLSGMAVGLISAL